jgi:hypothetical protein
MFKKITFLLLFFLPRLAFSFEPFLTDDSGTVAKGKNMIEMYYFGILEKADPNGPIDVNLPGEEFVGSDRATVAPLTYTRGISENLEAGVGLSYYGLPTGNYSPFANYVLSAKYRFYGNPEEGLSFAVKPSFTIGHSSAQQEAGLGMALPGYGINAIGTYAHQDFAVFFNIAYQHQPYNTNYTVAGGSEALRIDIYQVSIAPLWKISSKFHIGVDLGVVTNIVLADQNSYNYFIMPALIYTPIEALDIGISYLRVSATYGDELRDGPFTSIFKAGVTYRF